VPTPPAAPPHLDHDTWRSRRNRRLAAFLCLPGLTLGAFSLAGATAAGLFSPRIEHVCTAAAPLLPSPRSVTVRVYNASGIPGLAARTAAQLKASGFRVIAVGNAPEAQWFAGAPTVVHGTRGTDQAALVASKVPGGIAASDGRGDATVDVLLGAGAAATSTSISSGGPLAAQPCSSH
jgi:hypothetical protein